MKHAKQLKNARLLRAIGEIDDVLLQEAALYRPQRKSGATRVLMIAAVIALSTTLMLASVIVSMQGKKDAAQDPNNAGTLQEGEKPMVDLETLLLNCRGTGSYTTLSLPSGENQKPSDASAADGSNPISDGKAYVIWRYSDSDTLYVSRALTSAELKTLTKSIGDGERVGPSSPELSCQIWILLEDGTIVSPYLEVSAGNISQGELFDYQAELIPSDELISCIAGILD